MHFVKNKPLRTLKFIWRGPEEMGLLGSKAYTQAHKDDLDKYKNWNEVFEKAQLKEEELTQEEFEKLYNKVYGL